MADLPGVDAKELQEVALYRKLDKCVSPLTPVEPCAPLLSAAAAGVQPFCPAPRCAAQCCGELRTRGCCPRSAAFRPPPAPSLTDARVCPQVAPPRCGPLLGPVRGVGGLGPAAAHPGRHRKVHPHPAGLVCRAGAARELVGESALPAPCTTCAVQQQLLETGRGRGMIV